MNITKNELLINLKLPPKLSYLFPASYNYFSILLENLETLTEVSLYCLPKRKDKKNFKGHLKSLSSASESPFSFNYRSFGTRISLYHPKNVAGIAVICDSTTKTWAVDIDLHEKFNESSLGEFSAFKEVLRVYKDNILNKVIYKGSFPFPASKLTKDRKEDILQKYGFEFLYKSQDAIVWDPDTLKRFEV